MNQNILQRLRQYPNNSYSCKLDIPLSISFKTVAYANILSTARKPKLNPSTASSPLLSCISSHDFPLHYCASYSVAPASTPPSHPPSQHASYHSDVLVTRRPLPAHRPQAREYDITDQRTADAPNPRVAIMPRCSVRGTRRLARGEAFTGARPREVPASARRLGGGGDAAAGGALGRSGRTRSPRSQSRRARRSGAAAAFEAGGESTGWRGWDRAAGVAIRARLGCRAVATGRGIEVAVAVLGQGGAFAVRRAAGTGNLRGRMRGLRGGSILGRLGASGEVVGSLLRRS